ncbi:MAG: hypothetical protein ACM3MI_10705 [Clostridiales bacterium]
MLEKINVEKTIRLNKIYFENGRVFDTFFVLVCFALFVLTLPIASISYEIEHIDTISEDMLGSFFSVLIPLAFSAFIFNLIYTRKNLARFSNIDKFLIIAAVKELNWTIVINNQEYIIIEAGTWQRQISIIFDGTDILIHSLRFGRSDIYFRETSKLDQLMSKIKELKK